MPVVVATITQENRSEAMKVVWFCGENDISLADFHDEFLSGKFDYEAEPDKACQAFQVMAGSLKTDLTKVSPALNISKVIKLLGLFIKFVLAAEKHQFEVRDFAENVNSFLMSATHKRAAPSSLPPLFHEAHHQSKAKL